jgi:putative transposase
MRRLHCLGEIVGCVGKAHPRGGRYDTPSEPDKSMGPGKGDPPAKASFRQRLELHRGGPGEMARWPAHIRGAPYHPMTQGKIERWHQTLKNRILLENYYLPSDLEGQIKAFVADYNRMRYHEGIGNLTPADVYFGRGQTILIERERIKRQTIANRRLLHQRQAA